MSIHLYISKKCPFSDKLMKQIAKEEIVNHMEIINVDIQKPIDQHKVSHVPTIVFGNNTYVGKGIDTWLAEYKKSAGGKSTAGEDVFPGQNDDDGTDPFGEDMSGGGDPFASFGDIKPKVSDEMQARISMTVNEAYEKMNVQR